MQDAIEKTLRRSRRLPVRLDEDTRYADREVTPVKATSTCRCTQSLKDAVRSAIEGVRPSCPEHPTAEPPPAAAPVALNDDDALTALVLGATTRTTDR